MRRRVPVQIFPFRTVPASRPCRLCFHSTMAFKGIPWLLKARRSAGSIPCTAPRVHLHPPRCRLSIYATRQTRNNTTPVVSHRAKWIPNAIAMEVTVSPTVFLLFYFAPGQRKGITVFFPLERFDGGGLNYWSSIGAEWKEQEEGRWVCPLFGDSRFVSEIFIFSRRCNKMAETWKERATWNTVVSSILFVNCFRFRALDVASVVYVWRCLKA